MILCLISPRYSQTDLQVDVIFRNYPFNHTCFNALWKVSMELCENMLVFKKELEEIRLNIRRVGSFKNDHGTLRVCKDKMVPHQDNILSMISLSVKNEMILVEKEVTKFRLRRNLRI